MTIESAAIRKDCKFRRVAKHILCLSLIAVVISSYAADSLDSILAESMTTMTKIKQLAVLKVDTNKFQNKTNSEHSSDYILTKPADNSGTRVIKANSIPNARSLLAKTNINTTESNGTYINKLPNKLNNITLNQFNNLEAIDKDSNDLNQLNRKLQVEKVEAEIRKIKNGGSLSDSNHINTDNRLNENAQTTVTGVAINAVGKKIAWLQFADGGTLTVNIGSDVGKYKVIDINMTGVTIGEKVGNKKHKHIKTLFLKRVYAINTTSSKHGNFGNKINPYFTPSPIITGANTKSDYVPPIIPLN